MISSTLRGAFLCPVNRVSTSLDFLSYMPYINKVLKRDLMTITESQVIYADAISEDGIDYGTGYYVSQTYSDGRSDLYGPYNYEEDAKSNTNVILY